MTLVAEAVPPRTLLGAELGAGAFFLGMAALGLLLAHRLRQAGVWLGPDRVVVRNPLRTWMIPLSDATGFAGGVAAGGGNGTPCPLLRRRHGRPVGIWALGREGVVWHFGRYQYELEPLCDQLNVVLADLTAGFETTPVG
jgi:hypothetical protein